MAGGLWPARPGAGGLEVCGLGWLPGSVAPAAQPGPAGTAPAAVSTPALPDHLGEPLRQLWWPRMLAVLQAGTDRQRAAALLLPARWPDAGPAALATPTPIEPAALATLARLARAGDDPWVHSWALHACHAAGLPASCVGLSGRLLIRQAPQRAEGWLLLLAQEPAAQDEALDGLARATDWDVGSGRLARQVLQAWPGDAPMHLLPDLVLGLMAWESTHRSQAPWDALVLACVRPPASAEPPRRQACQRVVGRMLADGRDITTLATADMLAHRLGGPPAALAGEGGWIRNPVALAMGLVQAVTVPDQPHGCEAVARARRWVEAVARDGEAAALKAAMAEGVGLAGARAPPGQNR